jgi:hypothetical protein
LSRGHGPTQATIGTIPEDGFLAAHLFPEGAAIIGKTSDNGRAEPNPILPFMNFPQSRLPGQRRGLCAGHPESLPFLSRRDFLRWHANGIGALALSTLLGANPGDSLAKEAQRGPLAPKKPHFPAKARAVIQIYASGAPTTVDTWDPKPALNQYNGRAIPGYSGLALGSPFQFSRHGKSGIEVSEIFPELAKHVDEMAILRSLQAEIPDHKIASKALMTGSGVLNKPSLGSWTVYGLGSENQNLPGFVALGGDDAFRHSAFLPGIYQGCYVHYDPRLPLNEIINNISNPFTPPERQRHQLDFAREMNEIHAAQLQRDEQLEARIQAFQIAFNMQREALDAFDVRKETQATRDRYEMLPNNQRNPNGTKLLIARRLVERGVRFVQVTTGGWDTHFDLEKAVRGAATNIDRAAAALLEDLKDRGLLDSTLVLWGGEFGRTPTAQATTGVPGRDHNGKAMMAWMAGGGVKGGTVFGATDAFGGTAVENIADIHDLHATILALLGFDHERLTYKYNGRDFRLTDVSGNVIKSVIA